MRRRDFITLLGGTAATWPLAVRAQPGNMPVVGYISGRSYEGDAPFTSALLDSLKQSGFVDGRTMKFDARYANGQYGQVQTVTNDLVGKRAAVIVAGGTAVTKAAKAATASVPIVFITADDPVDAGLVTSMNKPSGNVTGASMVSAELRPKMLELLHEIDPAMTTVVMLVNPANVGIALQTQQTQAAASKFGLAMRIVKASSSAEIESVFASLPAEPGLALMVASDPFLTGQHRQIADWRQKPRSRLSTRGENTRMLAA